MKDYKIISNIPENRIEATIDNKVIGVINFHKSGDGRSLIVSHTGVDREYEGQGIAAAITKYLMDYARSNNLRIIPFCSYTRAYLERHSEYTDLNVNT